MNLDEGDVFQNQTNKAIVVLSIDPHGVWFSFYGSDGRWLCDGKMGLKQLTAWIKSENYQKIESDSTIIGLA